MSRTFTLTCIATLVISGLTPACAQHRTVGFETVDIVRPDGKALPGAIWYPSSSPSSDMTAGATQQNVALHGDISGDHLPLVVLSHGAFGSLFSHTDTATALAQAGFVVAAVTHDDFSSGGVLKLAGRSQQLHTLIDFVLHEWDSHSHVNDEKIGVFGFSIGGFTALVLAGARPDAAQIAPHCRTNPQEWSCQLAVAHHLDLANIQPATSGWEADPRIKAAVIAAPALGYIFSVPGLTSVRSPIQLWEAGSDHVLQEQWSAGPIKDHLPIKPEFHLVPNADHGDFVAPCAPSAARDLPKFCRDASGFDRSAFHIDFNTQVVRFFKRKLDLDQR